MEIGDQVQAGVGEDHDVGIVVALADIAGVRVAWSNGECTWEAPARLEAMPHCARCDGRRYNVIIKQCSHCGLDMP